MLTHEQAGFLGQDAYCYGSETLDECHRLGLCGPDGKINSAGLKALAAYDAKWVMVRRKDVMAAIAIFESHLCCAPLEDVAASFRAALEAKC